MSGPAAPLITPAVMVGIAGVLVAAAGLFVTLRRQREDSLRRSEVLDWANEVIAALEGLVMVCILLPRPSFAEEARQRLAKIAFDTAILTERGRIFFKNKPHGAFGADKKPAYQGFRPRVLDPLIAGHQIAVRLADAEGDSRIRLQCLAEDYLKDFVSLIQTEIGRDRTASEFTQQSGSGFNLDDALTRLPAERVTRVKKMAKNAPALYRKGAPGGETAA